MSVKEMFKTALVTKVMAVILALMIYSFCAERTVLWTVLGVIALMLFLYYSFRMGMGIGHESASVNATIRDLVEGAGGSTEKVDPALYKLAWSNANGIRGMFAGAILDYTINCLYIICMLAVPNMVAQLITRVLSWVVCLPYWPLVCNWHETYVTLTWDIVLVLMIGPFVFPLAQYLGYRMGPKLWEHTEKAMAQGRRRARARSRIIKKKPVNKQKGPEI